jgi:transposase
MSPREFDIVNATCELVRVNGVEATEGFAVLPLPPVEREVSTVGFEVLPLPTGRGRPKGAKNKVKEAPKPVKAEKAKRSRGRPRIYNGTHRRIVAAAIKHYGLTKGLEFLAKERNLAVSLTLARAVAKAEGITFKRGRPAA